MLKPPNNVKKLRHFLGILPWHVSEVVQNAGPSLNRKRVWTNKDHQLGFNLSTSIWLWQWTITKWYRLIQTSWSPYDIHTASTKRLGVVITQDNRPIAYFGWNSPARNQQHHYQIRTLSQKSSAEWCGDTNIRLYQPYLIRDGRVDTQQSTSLNNTLTGICPRDHLHMRIHNTVAGATMVNNPKVNSTIE